MCSYYSAEDIEIVVWDHFEYHANWTNNEAEATGLLRGFQFLKDNNIPGASFYGDSEIIMKGIFGSQNISDPKLEPIAEQIQRLKSNILVHDWAQVFRESNSYCDALADKAIATGATKSTPYLEGRSLRALEAAAMASVAAIREARQRQEAEAAAAERQTGFPFDRQFMHACLYTEELTSKVPPPPIAQLVDFRCAGPIGSAHHLHNVLEDAGLVIPRADARSLGDGKGTGRSMATDDLYATVLKVMQARPDAKQRERTVMDLAKNVGEWLSKTVIDTRVGLGNGTKLQEWHRQATGRAWKNRNMGLANSMVPANVVALAAMARHLGTQITLTSVEGGKCKMLGFNYEAVTADIRGTYPPIHLGLTSDQAFIHLDFDQTTSDKVALWAESIAAQAGRAAAAMDTSVDAGYVPPPSATTVSPVSTAGTEPLFAPTYYIRDQKVKAVKATIHLRESDQPGFTTVGWQLMDDSKICCRRGFNTVPTLQCYQTVLHLLTLHALALGASSLYCLCPDVETGREALRAVRELRLQRIHTTVATEVDPLLDAIGTTTAASRLSLLPTTTLPNWYGQDWPKHHHFQQNALTARYGPTVAVDAWHADRQTNEGEQQDQDGEAEEPYADVPKYSRHPDGNAWDVTTHHTHHFLSTRELVYRGVLSHEIAAAITNGTMEPEWNHDALTKLAQSHTHASIAVAWMNAMYRQPSQCRRQRGYDHASRLLATLARIELFPQAADVPPPQTPQQFILLALRGGWVRPDAVGLHSETMVAVDELPLPCKMTAARKRDATRPRRKWAAARPRYYAHAILDALKVPFDKTNPKVNSSQSDEEMGYFNKCLADEQAPQFRFPSTVDESTLIHLYGPEHAAELAAEHEDGYYNTVLRPYKQSEDTLRIATFNMRGLIAHAKNNATIMTNLFNYMTTQKINALILTEVRTGWPGGKEPKLETKAKATLLHQRQQWRDLISHNYNIYAHTSEEEGGAGPGKWLHPNYYEVLVLLSNGTQQQLLDPAKIQRLPGGRAINIPLSGDSAHPDGAINILGVYGPQDDMDTAKSLFATVLRWAAAAGSTPTIIGGDLNIKMDDRDVENGKARSTKDEMVEEQLAAASFTSALRATRRCRGGNRFSFFKLDEHHQPVPDSGSLIDHFLVPEQHLQLVTGIALRDVAGLRGPTADHRLLIMDFLDTGRRSTPTHTKGLRLRPTMPSPSRDTMKEFADSLKDMDLEKQQAYAEQIEALSATWQTLGEHDAARTAELWSTCTSKTTDLAPDWQNPASIDLNTLDLMTDDVLTATDEAFNSLYRRALGHHALVHDKSCRLKEKDRPLPAVSMEPEWFNLPGMQANELRLLISALKQAGYPRSNTNEIRERIVRCLTGTKHA